MQSKIFDAEVGYGDLVDELKVKMISILCDNQDEVHLEIEDIEEELNEEF